MEQFKKNIRAAPPARGAQRWAQVPPFSQMSPTPLCRGDSRLMRQKRLPPLPPPPSPGCGEALPARCKPGRESRTSGPRFEEQKEGGGVGGNVCGAAEEANVTRRGIWAGAAPASINPRVAAGSYAGRALLPRSNIDSVSAPKAAGRLGAGLCEGSAGKKKKDRTCPQLPLMRSL